MVNLMHQPRKRAASRQSTCRPSRVENLESRTLLSSQTFTGAGNNLAHPTWGADNTDLLRHSPAAYADGISAPAGAGRPSARVVSNAISSQTGDVINTRNLSDMVYVFGQFLDHDIDLTPQGSTEPFNVAVPKSDPSFDPAGTGTQLIQMDRSVFDSATGTGSSNPRQQINTITAFIDGSQIYGSDPVRSAALRSFVGGRLKTSRGDLLPKNTVGLPNANDAHVVADNQLFLAGDVRANENIELTAMQTLWMREHNRIARLMLKAHPDWTDQRIFMDTRRRIIGELQSITVNEFLPALLGPQALGQYKGYNPNVNPGVSTEFSTAAYRFGHSMLDGGISRMTNDGKEIPEGPAQLRNAFFNPTLLNPSLPNNEGNIDPLLKGSATGNSQDIDVKIVNDVRNFLFGPPGAGGFDLAALNIQRGRDHGLADYNSVRQSYGLPKVSKFADITSNKKLQDQLRQAYSSVNNIDLWTGGLAEDHAKGASVGPLFARIIHDQFSRLRNGDRFWFQNVFTGSNLKEMTSTTLAQVIERNTAVRNIETDVFYHY